MIEHTVESVERTRVGVREDWWAVAYVEPDGSRVRHVFPPETLHWRAAEYGIDPNDSQTLLDIVLHERHIVGHDHRSPDFVYTTDRDTARAALHDRISGVKTRHRVTDPVGHLNQICTDHRVDPEEHSQRSALVGHLRKHGTVPRKEPVNG